MTASLQRMEPPALVAGTKKLSLQELGKAACKQESLNGGIGIWSWLHLQYGGIENYPGVMAYDDI